MNILVNLPPAFFATEKFTPLFERLAKLGDLKKTSYNEEAEILDDLKWADAVIMWSWPVFDKDMLEAAGGLQFLGQIDTSPVTAKACLDLNIPLSLNKRGWSPSVAEMALGLMLSGLRRISYYHEQMRHSNETWGGLWPEGVDPRERLIEEVQVGLIGFGGVGQRLRHLLGAFGAQVSICDPYIPQEIVEQQKVTRLDINDLCESCDVVVLCAAANSGTKHVLGARELQRMKQDALLINVARASLVDTDALVKELQNNHIHACVDVFDQEPLDADHPIRSCKNAYLTPHRAGGVLASGLKVLGGLIDDLEARQQQQEPQHAFKECMLSMLDG